MESVMTAWTAVATSVADQGRRLAAAAGPACSCAAETGQQAGAVAWKLTRSTAKAAWIVGTSYVVLAVPLVIVMGREADIMDMENAARYEQDALLGLRRTA